jgi:hypothetical protein
MRHFVRTWTRRLGQSLGRIRRLNLTRPRRRGRARRRIDCSAYGGQLGGAPQYSARLHVSKSRQYLTQSSPGSPPVPLTSLHENNGCPAQMWLTIVQCDVAQYCYRCVGSGHLAIVRQTINHRTPPSANHRDGEHLGQYPACPVRHHGNIPHGCPCSGQSPGPATTITTNSTSDEGNFPRPVEVSIKPAVIHRSFWFPISSRSNPTSHNHLICTHRLQITALMQPVVKTIIASAANEEENVPVNYNDGGSESLPIPRIRHNPLNPT